MLAKCVNDKMENGKKFRHLTEGKLYEVRKWELYFCSPLHNLAIIDDSGEIRYYVKRRFVEK